MGDGHMEIIFKFADKHPVIFLLLISVFLMKIVDNEILSLGICLIWMLVGVGFGIKAIDKERGKW